MEKKKLTILLKNLFKIAKQNKWVVLYDRKLDYFCWSKIRLSEDSRLVKVSRDIFFYFNRKGLIEGLIVEYLKNNFIEHNPVYKDFPNVFTERIEKGVFTIPKAKVKEVESTLLAFTETLEADIYESALMNNQKIDDLDSLIDTAINK